MSVSRATPEVRYYMDSPGQWMVDKVAGVVARRADITNKAVPEAFTEFLYLEYSPVFVLNDVLRYQFKVLIPEGFSTLDTNDAHQPVSIMRWRDGSILQMKMTIKDWRANFERIIGTGGSPPLVEVLSPGVVVVPGQWAKWTIDVKWTYDNTGWMRIYHEDVLVYSHNGQSQKIDPKEPYWYIGLRHNMAPMVADTLSVYYDEVRVGYYPKDQGVA